MSAISAIEATSANLPRTRLFAAATGAALAAFLLRILLLIFSHFAQNNWHVDLQIIGQEAGFIAWALASGRGFANPFPGYEAATGWLAPVFPALWSLAMKIFDPRLSDKAVYFCQILNCAFSAGTCVPLAWLAERVFNRKIAAAAAWTWAFLPLAILFPLEWAWDQSLSALILTLLVCATYELKQAPANSKFWTGYGLGWGFAALVNPTLCVLLPFLLLWIAYCRRQIGAATLKPVLQMALVFALAITPWTARNYFQLGGFVFVKSNFGLEFCLGNNGEVPRNDVYSAQLHPMHNPQELLQLAMNGEPRYMKSKQRAAIAFIRSNPREFLRLTARKVLDTWTAWYDCRIDKWIRVLHLSGAAVVFCVGFSLLAIGGLYLALQAHFLQALPLALCVILLPVPYYLTHTTLRYRHPIDPMLTLFCVYIVCRMAAGGKTSAADAGQELTV